jgi:hypothetical protein
VDFIDHGASVGNVGRSKITPRKIPLIPAVQTDSSAFQVVPSRSINALVNVVLGGWLIPNVNNGFGGEFGVVDEPTEYSSSILALFFYLPTRPKGKPKLYLEYIYRQEYNGGIKEDMMCCIENGRLVILSQKVIVRVFGETSVQISIVLGSKGP